MKKKYLLMPLMVLSIACAALLAGCQGLMGTSTEDLITASLTEDFDAVKNLDDEFMSEVSESFDSSFSSLGIDSAEWVRTYFADFDYSITGVDVDDEAGTAVAHVTLTCKDVTEILNTFTEQYEEYAYSGEATDTETLYQKAGEILMEVTEATAAREVECDLAFTRDSDGNWAEDDSIEDEITNAMMS